MPHPADIAGGPSTRHHLRRRAVTIPTLLLATATATVTAPALLLGAALADLLGRGKLFATRTALFFLAYLWAETVGLCAAAWLWVRYRDEAAFVAANARTQRRWALFLFGAASKLFGIRTEVEGGDALDRPGPYLLYIRHASTLDTLIPFVIDPQRTFRYVLKEELLADPCLDVVGNRLRNCFVRRGGDRRDEEVARVVNLGRDVLDSEAVVIFPEGTRFTAAKRERHIARDDTDPLSARLHATLSPLRHGAVALGTQCRDLDVVIVAHRGVERAASLRDLLRGGLTRAMLHIKVWRAPASEVPRDEPEFRRWLAEQWVAVDAFVTGPP